MSGSALRHIKRVNSTSTVNYVAVTNCFSAEYDIYKITLSPIDSAGSDLFFRFLTTSNQVVNSSVYRDAVLLQRAYGAAVQNQSSSVDGIGSIGFSDLSDKGSGTTIWVYNPFREDYYTTVSWQNAGASSSGTPARRGVGELQQSSKITGIRFHQTNILKLDVNVYGLRES